VEGVSEMGKKGKSPFSFVSLPHFPRMRRIIIFLLTFLFIVSLTPSVLASSTYTVNLMVAYDEEFSSIAWSRYAYSAQDLATIIIWDTEAYFSSSFNIEFKIVAYRSWDSNDAVTNRDLMLDEVVSEVGFTSGMYVNYMRVDVLVAFSDQETIGVYGYSDKSLGVVLVMETYLAGVGQATDNVLQHELSHLYGAPDHYENGLMCVMNAYPYWIDFPYYYYVPTALVTNNWDVDCQSTISFNRGVWGRAQSLGGGGWHFWMEAW